MEVCPARTSSTGNIIRTTCPGRAVGVPVAAGFVWAGAMGVRRSLITCVRQSGQSPWSPAEGGVFITPTEPILTFNNTSCTTR